MKKYIFLIIFGLFLGVNPLIAQLPPATSVSQQTSLGKYTAEKTVENLVGSLYLFDNEWKVAELKSSDGAVYKDFNIKYDIVNDLLIYQGKANEIMEFVVPINEFSIGSLVFKNGYPSINTNTAKTFYQVLFEGKIRLLKKVTKTIIEAQNYNSPSMVKNIDTQTKYYIINKNGSIIPIKTNKKDVLDLLSEKSEQVKQYVSSHKVSFKNDEDLIGLFKFYDSLIL